MPAPVVLQSDIRLDTYAVISRAVEEGVAYGLRRAWKHDDSPNEEALQQHVESAVMNSLCEVIKFSEES